MNTPSLSSLAVLFAACVVTTAVGATDAPKSDAGKTTAAPKPAPAPAPTSKAAEPPHASTPAPAPKPAPAPAPKTPEPTHTTAPAPAPAPKTPEPTHTTAPPAPAPAPKSPEPTYTTAPAPAPTPKSPEPTHTTAPAPAPAPAPKPTPAPSPVSTSANTWDNWQGAKPVPTSFPAGVLFAKNTGDSATGERTAYFVGRTDVATTQGQKHEQHTASGAIRMYANLDSQVVGAQMGGFTSSTAATATTLNGMALTMTGSYDASGRITGTTAAQGQSLGKVTGTLTTTLAQGTWTLAKNDFAINATFRAGRVNAPGH